MIRPSRASWLNAREIVSRQLPIMFASSCWVGRRRTTRPSGPEAPSSRASPTRRWIRRSLTSHSASCAIVSSARRSRRAISPIMLIAVRGCACMWRIRSSRDSASSVVGSIARQCAERGPWSNSDISPNESPARSSDSVTSRPLSPNMTTFTRPVMITNIASPGSSWVTTAEPTGTLRTATRAVRSSIALIGNAANSGARAIVARIRAGSSPTLRASGVVGRAAGRGVAMGRAMPSVIGKAPGPRSRPRSARIARVVPAPGITCDRFASSPLPRCTSVGSVIQASQIRTTPGRGCRGRHN